MPRARCLPQNTELYNQERLVKEARNEGDLALAAILVCIKQERLYACSGYQSFGAYIDDRYDLFGFRSRHAERLVSGHRVLALLRGYCPAPSCERQVRHTSGQLALLKLLNPY